MVCSQAILEYNNILCGVQKNFSKGLITEKEVKEIGRFAFEYYLQWSPWDIYTRLTKDVLVRLRLDRLFKAYSDFPHELTASKDLFYYAHWLYPHIIPYDVGKGVLNVHKGVMADKRRYSMNFFDDEYGMDRAEICLLNAINSHGFANIREMYEFFGSDQGDDFIKAQKLEKPMLIYYKTPLKFFYSAIPEKYKSDFWYNYYNFKGQYEKAQNT